MRALGARWSRPWVIVGVVSVLALALWVFLTTNAQGADSPTAATVSNLVQLAAAGFATVAAGTVIGPRTGASRRAWILVTIACACWTVGQLIWCYVEIVQGLEMPQVSLADLFFLAFIVLMAVAVWPADGLHTDRLRTFLDAFIIGMSLLAISWTTSTSAIATGTDDSSDLLGVLVNLAYPCGDIVVLTIVLLSVSRQVGQRSRLTAVAAAMALIAVSDGVYAYLSASNDFEPGSLTSLGWVVGFGLIGCAALATERSGGPTTVAAPAGPAPGPAVAVPTLRMASMLPYVPLGIALVVVALDHADNGTDRLANLLILLTVVGVLVRQYLTIRDNATLTRHLASRDRELQRQAFADQLTGLPNRALFTDRVRHALEQHRRSLRPLALLFVDLDDFKAVNDTLGHPVGDQLVIRVAERLRGAVRASDTVARFGGDEFAVLVEGDTDAIDVGSRLVEALRPEFTLGTAQLSIGASIGIAEVPEDTATPSLDELFSRADIAMYAAKRAGKGQLASYETTMVLPEAADLQYRPLLLDAIRTGSIECVFQPVVDLGTGQVHCMEALARWRVGDQTPAQDYFIALAGRLNLLGALTDLMLDRACAQLADWSERLGRSELRVAVNVPPAMMTDPAFPARVAAVLRRYRLGRDRLVLEITENALLGTPAETRRVTERLRSLGVSLSLDDFGTGTSSLRSLRQIDLDGIKIDIAFIAGIDTDIEAERFLRAVLALGRDLNLQVTAEGVERPAQAAVLRTLGCPFVQGYLYARPGPAAEMEQYLTAPGTLLPMAVL